MKKTIAVLGVAGALLFGAGTAGAQEVDTYEETPPPVDVGGEGVVPGSPSGEELGTDVLGDSVTRGSSTLPVTGGDLVGLAGIGAAAIAAGSGALLYRRRQLS